MAFDGSSSSYSGDASCPELDEWCSEGARKMGMTWSFGEAERWLGASGGRLRSMDPVVGGDFATRITVYPSSCVSERGKNIYKISVVSI